MSDTNAVENEEFKMGDMDPDEEPQRDYNSVVEEVLNGEWGQGQEQRLRLSQAGYDPNEVRRLVNRRRNNL